MRLVDIIKEDPDIDWNFFFISMNADITIQDMLDNPQFKWDYSSVNYKATISDILKPILTGPRGGNLWRWNWTYLSQILPVDDILAHKELEWNWKWVSQNNPLTFDHVLAHDDIPWSWDVISIRCPFRVDYYRNDPYKPWNFYRLSWNIGLHIDDVLANLDLKWDWAGISSNATLTIDHILKHHKLPWKWDKLSSTIPVRDIFKYPGLPWNWRIVEYNKKITFDDFVRNSHEKLMITCNRRFLNSLKIEQIKFIFENKLLKDIKGHSDEFLNRLVTNQYKRDFIQYMSWFANISMNDVIENQWIPWSKEHLLMNSFICPKDIIQHADYFDKDILCNIFRHVALTVDDIRALKELLPEKVFRSEMRKFIFISENITIVDMLCAKDLKWNWGGLSTRIKVDR